jgi:cell division protein FtsI/penicillin-binding protein 2
VSKIKLNINDFKNLQDSKIFDTQNVIDNINFTVSKIKTNSTRKNNRQLLQHNNHSTRSAKSNSEAKRGKSNKIEYIFESIFFAINKFFFYLSHQGRTNTLRVIVASIFIILILHLANLQISGFYSINGTQVGLAQPFMRSIIVENNKRGQIYIQDFGQNNRKIAITSSTLEYNLYLDISELKNSVDEKDIENVISNISSSLNLPYNKLLEMVRFELNKKTDRLNRFLTISTDISSDQREVAQNLINSSNIRGNVNYVYGYYKWLRIDEVAKRQYPQGELMASTIGYIPRYRVSRDEMMKTECRSVIEENEKNGIPSKDYTIGYYGIEQKYCSLISGRNGLSYFKNGRLEEQNSLPAKSGADLYLTIDMTIQQKAEEILAKTIVENTNPNGKPRNGSIIVMNPKTGRIYAMASSPSFDPNNYDRYKTESYRNVATSEDYEVGSSMKPLTVAAALSEWEKGTVGSQSQKLGVSPLWKKRDYDKNGKIYRELNGTTLQIFNSQKMSYANRENDLKIVIRDSLNTMISDITDSVGNLKLREYFKEKFMFDVPTEMTFAGGGNGNITNFDRNIDCQYCYAQHGFGQGFAIAPIQLMRAYSAIANKGKMVEPYFIDKIIDGDNNTSNRQDSDLLGPLPAPKQIFTEQSARLVTEYMKAVIDEGYLGVGGGKNGILGYSIAAKTGTAEITTNVDGKYCDYQCNSKKGLFDHTAIGFGPTTDPEVMVLVKLSQPRPGVIANFADTTSMPAFKDMMQFSLDYLKIRKDR